MGQGRNEHAPIERAGSFRTVVDHSPTRPAESVDVADNSLLFAGIAPLVLCYVHYVASLDTTP
jgi:hypothetical protein